MKGKPNIDAFLDGVKATAAEKAPVEVEKPAKAPRKADQTPAHAVPAALDEPRITKTIRLARSLDTQLKEEAFRRSMAGGKRVAESDLIEEALLQYFSKQVNN